MDGSGLIASTKSAKIGCNGIMTLIIWFLSPLRKSTDTEPTVDTTLKKKTCKNILPVLALILKTKSAFIRLFCFSYFTALHGTIYLQAWQKEELPNLPEPSWTSLKNGSKFKKSVEEKRRFFCNMEKNHWLFWSLHMLVVVLMYSFFIITCHTSLIYDSLSKHLKL